MDSETYDKRTTSSFNSSCLDDTTILQSFLDAIHPNLREQVSRHYKFEVKRNSLTKGDEELKGTAATHPTYIVVDACEGLCITGAPGSQRILVRSYAEDGSLMVDFGTLMHEIGHGFDNRIACFFHARSTCPLHEKEVVVDAHKKEHQRFDRTYFHPIAEFVAEVFSQYSLDRGRAMKKFPLMCKVFDDEMRLAGILTDPASQPLVDSRKLRQAIEAMIVPPPITTSGQVDQKTYDGLTMVMLQEGLNDRYEANSTPRQRYMIGLITEDEASARLYSKFVARQLFYHRSTHSSLYNLEDAFFEANLKNSIEDELTKRSAHHAFVLFSSADQVVASSIGMQHYRHFSDKKEDFCVPVFYGNEHEIDRLRRDTSFAIWRKCRLDSMSPSQVAAFVCQVAASDRKMVFRFIKFVCINMYFNLFMYLFICLHLSFGHSFCSPPLSLFLTQACTLS